MNNLLPLALTSHLLGRIGTAVFVLEARWLLDAAFIISARLVDDGVLDITRLLRVNIHAELKLWEGGVHLHVVGLCRWCRQLATR